MSIAADERCGGPNKKTAKETLPVHLFDTSLKVHGLWRAVYGKAGKRQKILLLEAAHSVPIGVQL